MAKMLKDRYQLTAELGKGGMGTVYQGTDTKLDRDVAIKLLSPQLSQDPTFLQRFEREAKAITSLEHNNIVPVYDFGQDRNQTFLVMRLLKGGDLKKRIENNPLPMQDVIRILRQVGSALDRAHDNSIIHRDLKPGNILFDDDGNAFLGDFGIVKLTNESTSFTQTGGTLGTPYYMSPEQIRDPQSIDHRTDIYALGVILYEMLTGNLPYEATSAFDLQNMHVNNPIPDILEANPDLPNGVKDVIHKAMAKDREERFGSAKEMLNALEIAASAPEPAAPPPPTAEPEPEPATAEVPTATPEPEEPAAAPVPEPVAEEADPQPEPEAAAAAPPTKRGRPTWLYIVGGAVIGIILFIVAIVALVPDEEIVDEPVDEPAVVAAEPTEEPTAEPDPTEAPTAEPDPTEAPDPTEEPTAEPEPTDEPAAEPEPTDAPDPVDDGADLVVSENGIFYGVSDYETFEFLPPADFVLDAEAILELDNNFDENAVLLEEQLSFTSDNDGVYLYETAVHDFQMEGYLESTADLFAYGIAFRSVEDGDFCLLGVSEGFFQFVKIEAATGDVLFEDEISIGQSVDLQSDRPVQFVFRAVDDYGLFNVWNEENDIITWVDLSECTGHGALLLIAEGLDEPAVLSGELSIIALVDEESAESASSSGATSGPPQLVADQNANIYSEADSDSSVEDVLTAGSEADIIGRDAGSRWWLIETTNGTEGWVFGDLVTTSGDLSSVDVATSSVSSGSSSSTSSSSGSASGDTAGSTLPPISFSGTIASDSDFRDISLDDYSGVTIEISVIPDSDFDVSFFVIDSSITPVTDLVDDGGEGGEEVLIYTVPETGSYAIRVFGFDISTGSYTGAITPR